MSTKTKNTFNEILVIILVTITLQACTGEGDIPDTDANAEPIINNKTWEQLAWGKDYWN